MKCYLHKSYDHYSCRSRKCGSNTFINLSRVSFQQCHLQSVHTCINLPILIHVLNLRKYYIRSFCFEHSKILFFKATNNTSSVTYTQMFDNVALKLTLLWRFYHIWKTASMQMIEIFKFFCLFCTLSVNFFLYFIVFLNAFVYLIFQIHCKLSMI